LTPNIKTILHPGFKGGDFKDHQRIGNGLLTGTGEKNGVPCQQEYITSFAG
jgi:hypothetical protein